MQHTAGSPQQFCLRWNNYQSNLTNVFDQLLQSESFVDVTLACDGHSMKCHKMVLSACSPYFQSLFFENPCQHPIVIMRDIKWPELKAAVEFMYKGEINVSQEQIGPLLRVAESLKIRGLADVNGEQDTVTTAAGEITTKPSPIKQLSTTTPVPMTPNSNSSAMEWDGRESGNGHPAKKRRRSGERSSISSPGESAASTTADIPEPPLSVEMSPAPSATPLPPSSSAEPMSLNLPLPSHVAHMPSADDMEIKPGIAEMIREEERAKLLESSHAWLGASTSSIADYPTLLKLKTPTWTQEQLKEAIEAVVTQKMRFTQASTRYGIPKGTLYDNILGKSKRMAVLEEAGLTAEEENAVLEFCCDVSVSPYNRRTKKSLKAVLGYVEKLRRIRDPEFLFTGLSGFRWWWAFCKKHSIVSLHYENNITDSYQYQLQSMWQKCWNTNQSLVHHLRFRERGPLKSWRPETMAEAIFSVLKEGLSLSQAARKYDIPYPTFVLYANRVHNMLGPSADGGSDLRPKGRGRPQRILLGIWPDEHIRGVIRAVVFRDSHHIKEEQQIHYPRIHDSVSSVNTSGVNTTGTTANIQNFPNTACNDGSDPNVSPAAAAAAVAAVAQGLRQQMCSMVAAANQSSAHETNPVASLVNSLAFGNACGNMQNNGSLPMGMMPNMSHITSLRSISSPAGCIQDLRISPSESALESPISSPLGLTVPSSMEQTMNLSLSHNMNTTSATGMTYKSSRPYSSPRPENLFQEDINDLVKPINSSTPNTRESMPIKLEPMTECRGE